MIQTPEDNTFTRQPLFIERDHRTKRPTDVTKIGQPYAVTTEFMYNRHRIMLPKEIIEGKTVLDIGSCYGATGAWCLDNGAAHYTGLEPQHKFVEESKQILGTYYDSSKFDVIEEPFDTFNTDRKWDVVVASGVLYGIYDQYDAIKKIASMAKESIIVESQHPFSSGKLLFAYPPSDDWLRLRMRTLNIIQIVDETPMMIDAERDGNIFCTASVISAGALVNMFKNHGWNFDDTSYNLSEMELPEHYDVVHPTGRRYMTRFYPGTSRTKSFVEVYKDPKARRVSWLNGVSITK